MTTTATEALVLSPSRINCYLKCPRSYYYQYIERVQMPASPAMAVGSAVHEAIQKVHAAKWSLANKDEAAAALDELWQEQLQRTADPENPDAAKDIAAARDVWLPWYLQWIEPHVDIAVEEEFTLPIPGTDLAMRGFIDRVYRADGETIISDVKTGKRAPSAGDLATDLQLSMYSWAYREMVPGNCENALEIVQIRSKTVLRTTRTDEYLQHVVDDVIVPTAQAIQAGFFPANPGTKYGCSYCQYQGVCPVGQGA